MAGESNGDSSSTTPTPVVTAAQFLKGSDGIYRAAPTRLDYGLGGIGIAYQNAVGAVTMEITSQAPFSRSKLSTADGSWNLVGYSPPFKGVLDRVVVTMTDSATPTPNTATVTFESEVLLPATETMYRGAEGAAVRFVTADWPVVMDKAFSYNDDHARLKVHQHVTDGRIVVKADVWRQRRGEQRTDGHHSEVLVADALWQQPEVCRLLVGTYDQGCQRAVRSGLEHLATVCAPVLV